MEDCGRKVTVVWSGRERGGSVAAGGEAAREVQPQIQGGCPRGWAPVHRVSRQAGGILWKGVQVVISFRRG